MSGKLRHLWWEAWESSRGHNRTGGSGGQAAASGASVLPDNDCGWTEAPPPRRSSESMVGMKQDFKFSYPSETLDSGTTPGPREWSDVCQMFRPGDSLRWQPWNQIVSEKEYFDLMKKKGTRHPQ